MAVHLELSVQETKKAHGDNTPHLVVWLSENRGRRRLLERRVELGHDVDVRGVVSIEDCKAYLVVEQFERLLAENGYEPVDSNVNTDDQGRNLGRGYALHPRLVGYATEVFSGLERWASEYSDPKRVWV